MRSVAWFVAGAIADVASAVAGPGLASSEDREPATGTPPGMTRMHEGMLGEDSEKVHEQMMRENPGVRRLHEAWLADGVVRRTGNL